ncbi:MAG TPA: ATP-binding protein [Methylobacterium sp.]|uniref:HAMP domain-containing sensor histidine kinase n=1 Tax=Methylorubrum sp. B1-46 TaxID=2897334 RepID=UPI001E62518E|nr:ATP-binding protein [Methylorubrum sp. B1-46]UGB26462.1 HAMP domain-containing histidine kinase [Methylorubrum sp. B1-46]HEV2543418.1 ATP-binding protein [Methylobacterium sp.]
MSPAASPPQDGLLARLGKIFRTTAFKLSLAYLVLFAVLASLGLGYVAWNARRVLDDQIVSTIDAEINGLSEQYTAGGLRRLITVVERRAKEPGASLYLVTTPAGEHIVGNVSRVSPDILARPGQYEGYYGRGSEADQGEHRAIMRVFNLAGGFRLLVGRDTEERDRLRAAIGNTFGSSLALVVVLGVLGGWFVASRVLKRVDDMTETTRTIMAGDLDGRLRVSGTGDELDRLAQNLNLMLERIGELMRGMKEVSDNIAHDLKTPLTRLRNRADEALRTAETPEALRTAIEGVIEDSDGLIRVFNALLTIARLEAGNAPESLRRFDAGAVAREVAELYEPLAEDRGLSLIVRTEPDLTLDGNRELVGQAIANLLDNAIKYGAQSPEAGPQAISVSAVRADGAVRITVADRGPGIPEGERGRVLDRFVRLDAARTRPGFGLGLSLVNAVSRLHGGSLELADNAPGLAVTLNLPATTT